MYLFYQDEKKKTTQHFSASNLKEGKHKLRKNLWRWQWDSGHRSLQWPALPSTTSWSPKARFSMASSRDPLLFLPVWLATCFVWWMRGLFPVSSSWCLGKEGGM